jgi:hypothetical protein
MPKFKKSKRELKKGRHYLPEIKNYGNSNNKKLYVSM